MAIHEVDLVYSVLEKCPWFYLDIELKIKDTTVSFEYVSPRICNFRREL